MPDLMEAVAEDHSVGVLRQLRDEIEAQDEALLLQVGSRAFLQRLVLILLADWSLLLQSVYFVVG